VDRWSAASEGVLAALRLSKSAQSADKVHFSDSTKLPWEASENFVLYQLLAVTTDQQCAVSIKSALFLSQLPEKLDKNRIYHPIRPGFGGYNPVNATRQKIFLTYGMQRSSRPRVPDRAPIGLMGQGAVGRPNSRTLERR
jgi:hypothetical protein